MPIAATRALLAAALDGTLTEGTFRKDPHFGFEVPTHVPGVDTALLNPKGTWADPTAYDKAAQKLVQMFSNNFGKYLPHVDEDVRAIAIAIG
jgi:phosphoenolpyruvate carboxykinase (ATP)